MADSKKCDRCGAYYDKYLPGYGNKKEQLPPLNSIDEMVTDKSTNYEKLVRRIDLCPNCARFIHATLTSAPSLPPVQ